ncbi:hypothetical protein vseg_017460 [Gypsophila vaccaria]
MGCCASTSTCRENNTNKKQSSLEKKHHFSSVSKSPPTPEVELVKEVLSETPKPEPETDTDTEPEIKVPDYCEEKHTQCEVVLGAPNKPHFGHTSDQCHQRVYTSQGYDGHFVSDRWNSSDHSVQLKCHGRSPVRTRVGPSPPRRYSGRVGLRRDVVGENSARRSPSPVTRSNVGRSPSGRRTGVSPGRVRMVHGPEETKDEWAGPRESLENPLVSMECFIFL